MSWWAGWRKWSAVRRQRKHETGSGMAKPKREMNPAVKKLKRLPLVPRGEKGVFTLEAGLIFPFLLLANIAFILLALYVYEYITLQIQASVAAERIAQHWHESPAEGRLPLYWRITEAGNATVEIPASGHAAYKGSGISGMKIAKGVQGIPDGITGTVKFENKVIRQFIDIKLEQPLRVSKFVTKWLPHYGENGKVQAEATAEIMDSTEFSRYIDFAFGYALKTNSNSIMATKDAFVKVFQLIPQLIK